MWTLPAGRALLCVTKHGRQAKALDTVCLLRCCQLLSICTGSPVQPGIVLTWHPGGRRDRRPANLHPQANMGVSPEQRAEVKRLRDAHLQRLQNLQVARHQLTANVTTAGAKPNNTAQVCSIGFPDAR